LLVLTASGVTYLQASVQERSVLGPRLVEFSRDYLQRVLERFPGAAPQGGLSIPPMKAPGSRKKSS